MRAATAGLPLTETVEHVVHASGLDAHYEAEKGGQEVSLPVLASTLTTIVVFFPVTFLYGVMSP